MTTLFRNGDGDLRVGPASTLASGVAVGATSMSVAPGTGNRFPVVASPDVAYVTLENATNFEVIKITARVLGADTMTIVKAQEGTTARAWLTGDIVSMRITAAQAELGANAQAVAAAALSASMASHTSAADPHTGYTTTAELATGLATKQAALGYTPVNIGGDTMTGRLNGYPVNATTGADTAASMEIRNFSGTGDAAIAALAFHCQGAYGTKLHLRSDGSFGLGGWSSAAWRWYSDASGNMLASGNVTAYSDPRLKKNFKRVSDPLAIIGALDGGTFNWKHGFAHTECKAGKRDYGILADQVEAVMPEIVTESIEIDGERYKTVAYDKLVPVLIEAIKVQQAQIDALMAKVEGL